MSDLNIPFNFKPRPYQLPLLKALDAGKDRACYSWHRRSGKDKTALAGIVSKKMLERVGSYYYVLPTLTQGRKIIWDGADRDGFRFLDHFPKELIDGNINKTEMKFRLHNGSLLQMVGSDSFNSVMGTNPIGLVFSEYSLQDPLCWGHFRPILAENGGWAIFNFTPRGENHAYDLLELARADPENWFSEVLTVDDTGAVKPEMLEREKREIIRLDGTDALFQQEYYCSFTAPIVGAYYGEHITRAYRDSRVGKVPHDPQLSVDTIWDLGINDRMAIWFTQSVGQELRFIDYLEGTGAGLSEYISQIKEKPYIYGRHVAPHDIKVRELGTGKSRLETARNLGINFDICPNIPIMDGIDAARGMFNRSWFDQDKCKAGLNALKNYRKKWDEARKTYQDKPFHNWASNGADAFRYRAVSISADYKSAPAGEPDKYLRKKRSRGHGSSAAVFG